MLKTLNDLSLCRQQLTNISLELTNISLAMNILRLHLHGSVQNPLLFVYGISGKLIFQPVGSSDGGGYKCLCLQVSCFLSIPSSPEYHYMMKAITIVQTLNACKCIKL